MPISQKKVSTYSFFTGLAQSACLYPLDVANARQFLNGSHLKKLPRPLAGFSVAASQRGLKTFVTLSSFNQFQKVSVEQAPEWVNRALAGTLTGMVEGVLFTPFSVLKNHLQAHPTQGLQATLKQLKPCDYSRGWWPTVKRNMVFSSISMGVFGKWAQEDDTIAVNVTKCSISFLCGGLATLPFEWERLGQVFNQQRQASLFQKTKLLAPGLLKVSLMGGLFGPSIHNIIYPTNDSKH